MHIDVISDIFIYYTPAEASTLQPYLFLADGNQVNIWKPFQEGRNMKGCKVTDWKRSRIFGVACNSLYELKRKGSKKLQLDSEQIIVRLQDGTFVDTEDYFETLPTQTLFLLVLPQQDVLTGYELLYNMLTAVHKNYMNVGKFAADFLSQDIKAKIRDISVILDRQSSFENAKLSTRADDPSWFEGLETMSSTKEEFMFRRSQERIRGYLYKSMDDVKRSLVYVNDAKARTKLDNTFVLFKTWLKEYKYFGCYFDRRCTNSSELLKGLCDEQGEFLCQGKWNEDKCNHFDCLRRNNLKHTINPYVSKEARIVFSTWNLDHRIERARQVCPALLKAAKLSVSQKRSINAVYFFSLLFTALNLRLVHIVCHDKGEHHGAVCNLQKLTTVGTPSINHLMSNKEFVLNSV